MNSSPNPLNPPGRLFDAVVKIGGSLLSGAADYTRQAENLIRMYIEGGWRVLVVVSAGKGVTDCIIRLLEGEWVCREEVFDFYQQVARELGGSRLTARVMEALAPLSRVYGRVKEPSIIAHLLSLGEAASRIILSHQLEAGGVRVLEVEAELLVRARGDPLESRIDYHGTMKSLWELSSKMSRGVDAVVVEGFVAGSNGERLVLGRGGSDYTATALASLSGASYAHLVTDVDGIYTGDPARLRSARRLPAMGYLEAEAAARLGVKRMHPRTFEPHSLVHPVEVRIGSWREWTRIKNTPEVYPPGLKVVSSRRGRSYSEVYIVGSMLNDPRVVARAISTVNSRGVPYMEVRVSPYNHAISFKVEAEWEWELLEALHSIAGVV